MPGDKFYISSNITLYAIWKNSSSGGNVTPTDKQQVKIGSTHTIGKNKYRVTSTNTVTYIGSTNKNTTKLVIPDSIKLKGKTYKVTAIGAKAFANATKATTVTLPASIKTIGAQAFTGAKSVKTIVIKSASVKVDKTAFKGVDTKKMTIKVSGMSAKQLKAFKAQLKKAGFKGTVKKVSK